MFDAKACDSLRRAEREIRGLMVEAATSGAYAEVARLNLVAQRLSEIIDFGGSADALQGKPGPADASGVASPTSPKRQVKPRKSKGKPGYPRFERHRDQLIKIGWSKKDRREYVHKTPRAGVEAVVRRVGQLGHEGRVFKTEDLLPVMLAGTAEELSGYQSYICLAWLVRIGAVHRHGREGYSVKDAPLEPLMNLAWEALPNKAPRSGR
jgi:hypothetical protein